MGNPEEQDPQQGDIGRGCRSNRAGETKLGAALCGYIKMNYLIGLVAGAVIGGVIGYLGKCAGST